MKSKRPYRLTETGIRIPTRKIKWMSSPKSTKSKSSDIDLEISISAPKNFKHLLNSNFDALVQGMAASESDDIITCENWREGNHNDS